MVDPGPREGGDPARNVGYDLGSSGGVKDPVEDAGLAHAQKPGALEDLSRQQHSRLGARRVEVEASNGVADQSGEEDEVGVLDEELVGVLELGTEGAAQQLGPQLALERDSWLASSNVPA